MSKGPPNFTDPEARGSNPNGLADVEHCWPVYSLDPVWVRGKLGGHFFGMAGTKGRRRETVSYTEFNLVCTQGKLSSALSRILLEQHLVLD